MDGVTDAPMRELYTKYFPFTHCVSEFLRITQNIPPAKIYLEHVPELKTGSKTTVGTPILFQLLGGDPDRLATAAILAVQLGAVGIDLNFGCPAKTVNKNDGGATLLKSPERIYQIVKTVRAAVAPEIPVSAKIRLGWDSVEPVYKVAEMINLAGADWLTIHARTRMQGYAPPVFYEPIANVMKSSSIPVIANGDLWTLEDFLRCREMTQCTHYMFGRAALANPQLISQVAYELGLDKTLSTPPPAHLDDLVWQKLFAEFNELSIPRSSGSHYTVKRMKQWASYINRRSELLRFDDLKRTEDTEQFLAILNNTPLFK